MKKQVSGIAFGLMLSVALGGYSQDNRIQPCNTYAAMEELFAANPQMKANYEANEKQLRNEYQQRTNNVAGKSAAAFQYTVPVVFHILHTNGAENITDAQCIAALAQVNSDLARMGSDANTVAQPFQNLYINSDIKLMLAHKDPNGNCTSGIVHRYDTRTTWDRSGNLTALYSGITWNPTKYLNIIIVKDIVAQTGQTGIVIGYTYKPGTWGTGANQDAIVYRYSALGGLDARSLTHELGHWLSLDHTFGNTNNPGVTCGDDGLYDTPPTKGNFSTCPPSSSGNVCAASGNSVWASGQQNTENIMDYSSCPKNFTTDQTNAIRNALASTVSNRQNLWQTANLLATDVNNLGSCAPIADYYTTNNSYTVCSGGSLTFKDYSYNASITGYQWAGDNGAVVASATSSITTIMFPTLGTSNVTLTVSNGQGSSIKVRTITVLDGTASLIGPTVEGFEASGVPAGWNVINADANSTKWDQTYDAYYEGFASFFIEGALAGPSQVDILESPIMNIAGSADKTFFFSLAYAQKSSTHNDLLKIQASKDCGGSWVDLTALSGSQMQLNSGGITANSFTPFVQAEWKTYTISNYPAWNSFINSTSVKLRFTFVEGTAGAGNNLYIDAINLFNQAVGINELAQSYQYYLAPNPANGESTVNFTLYDAAKVKVSVMDMLGKEVATAYDGNVAAGEQSISINKNAELSPGVYFVNLSVNGAKMSSKLIVH